MRHRRVAADLLSNKARLVRLFCGLGFPPLFEHQKKKRTMPRMPGAPPLFLLPSSIPHNPCFSSFSPRRCGARLFPSPPPTLGRPFRCGPRKGRLTRGGKQKPPLPPKGKKNEAAGLGKGETAPGAKRKPNKPSRHTGAPARPRLSLSPLSHFHFKTAKLKSFASCKKKKKGDPLRVLSALIKTKHRIKVEAFQYQFQMWRLVRNANAFSLAHFTGLLWLRLFICCPLTPMSVELPRC